MLHFEHPAQKNCTFAAGKKHFCIMITFFIALAVLIVGYIIYGKLVERIFGIDPERETCATSKADGVDYIPLKPWRIFLIQFLNIAGVGPIIGAIMGAQFGTASFLWIVLGSIFAGAVHDYLAGMISLRDDGASLPEIHGKYLGNGTKQFMRGFTVLLMILVGVVFVNTPATLIDQSFSKTLYNQLSKEKVTFDKNGVASLDGKEVCVTIDTSTIETGELAKTLKSIPRRNVDDIQISSAGEKVLISVTTSPKTNWTLYICIFVILAYYLTATLLPIDKLIGRIYPVFGILLIGMAVAILVAFFLYKPEIPEIWSGLQNRHPDAANNPIFPMMFISIACGAISGFHATQSPLMARCMTNEKQGRPIFYGAMITEGIVALIWAAAAAYFFGPDSVVSVAGKSGAAIVGVIAYTWFTPIIATITILGVISAAVTSGDTALRSARLIIADFMHFDQKPIKNRLLIAVPMFAVTALILVYSISDASGFQIIWRYFAWANQVLATVTLWAITVYLFRNKGGFIHLITLFPALFMTMVTSCFLFVAQPSAGGIGLSPVIAYSIGGCITLASLIGFCIWANKYRKQLS